MNKHLKALQVQLVESFISRITDNNKKYDLLHDYDDSRLMLMSSLMAGKRLWALEKLLPVTIKYLKENHAILQIVLKNYFIYKKPTGEYFFHEALNFYQFIQQKYNLYQKELPYLFDILEFEIKIAKIKFAQDNWEPKKSNDSTIYYSLGDLGEISSLNYDIKSLFKTRNNFSANLEKRPHFILIFWDESKNQIRVFELDQFHFILMKMAQRNILSYQVNKQNSLIQYLVSIHVLEKSHENLFHW